MSYANLSLDDRTELESLVATYTQAELSVRRAIGERHDAMHAIHSFVNALVAERLASVPTGTPSVPTETDFPPNPAASGGN